MFSSTQFVLDAGAGHVAGAVFAPGPAGKIVLEEFVLVARDAAPSLESGWMKWTGQAMAAMAARKKVRGPAALAVPGHLTLTKFVTTPAVAPAKRSQVVRFEAAQAIPYPLEAVAWDHLVVRGDAQDIELMLTAVKLDAMENLCAAAESAGFPVKRAAASCLALYRAFGFNYPGVGGPALVVDLGARSTNVLLTGPGGRFFARTFALAGNHVTAAIAEELGLDGARAERLKLEVLAGPPGSPGDSAAQAAVQRATDAFLGRLQLELTRTIGNFSLRTGGAKPAVIYLTGGGSLIRGLAAALAEKFQLPVERYDPWRNLELSDRARASGAESATHLLANLVGLAVPADATAESGLLPPAVRAARAFRRRQPYLLGAVTLAACALLPPLGHYHRLAKAEETRASEQTARLQAVRAMAERNRADLEKIAAMQREMAALRNLAAAKTGWIAFLADLQERLGKIGDVWLDELTVAPPAASGPADPAAGAVRMPGALQLRLSGRLLDVRNPVSKVSPDSAARVKELLAGVARSPFIAAIGDERFDTTQPGLLRFDFTVALNPGFPL
jgi:type IV pilus assembly protein PilM